MDKLIIEPKDDIAVTMTIRIDSNLQKKYNELSAKTNCSRNKLINMALQYAIENIEVLEKG